MSVLYEIEQSLCIDGPSTAYATLVKTKANTGVKHYTFTLAFKKPIIPKPIRIHWKIPAKNVAGLWKPTGVLPIQALALGETMKSCITKNAPITTVFGRNDANIVTFACNNAVQTLLHTIVFNENDNHLYCDIIFFSDTKKPITNYTTQIRFDANPQHFSESIINVSTWWESFTNLKPIYASRFTRRPVYNASLNLKKNGSEIMLKKECVLASLMGFKVLVLDDIALQCNANDKKGSIIDFNFANFVSQIQAIGMRVGIQFSVPYCGEKTKTYEQFKGKFLTENHNLGTILDPRYPEIREHLVQLYTKALKEYKIDGFKFDFINLLHHYEDTPELEGNYLSINDAVNCLLNDITTSLLAINPDVFIAFNQEFVSPAMRKYGNMLCGVNCFGDFELQRVRIADMRMLCGDTATHSALNTWHPNEAVEITAIKLIPSLFGVPQVNIAFLKAGYETINTVRFYMEYWNNNAAILLSTNFKPYNPLDNYPYQKATLHKQVIISISGNHTVPIDEEKEIIHLFNTKLSTEIELNCPLNFGEYSALIYNCQGVLQYHKILNLNNTVLKIDVPAGGMIQMKKTKKLE